MSEFNIRKLGLAQLGLPFHRMERLCFNSRCTDSGLRDTILAPVGKYVIKHGA